MLDPDRVSGMRSIMDRYSRHLQDGHRVRLGVEGDPYYPYRSGEAAPVGTVHDVARGDGGRVDFKVTLDGSGEVRALHNLGIAPEEAWEINPDDLAAYRGATTEAPPAAALDTAPLIARMDAMEDNLSELKGSLKDLASDILSIYRGESAPPRAARGAVDRHRGAEHDEACMKEKAFHADDVPALSYESLMKDVPPVE